MHDHTQLALEFRRRVAELLGLTGDQAAPETIDATIRAGSSFRGTNLWLLIFATLIASIGLNVNSAAVIIGAMLVSPLMGPIMAAGYGAAVNDSRLMRSALRNLGLAVGFSLLTSTVYFLLTPLSEARSEILARTSPAIWDVLIALFGGFAGIVGVTRKEKSNVIPGVAIATALMPPLCTGGYGIATGQGLYALGALYLFSINSVFIATATLLTVRAMRLPEVEQVDERTRARTRTMISLIVLVTGVPSIWLAVGLVQQELFSAKAQQFISAAFPSELGSFVVGSDIDGAARSIRVTILGEPVSEDRRVSLDGMLVALGLEGARLEIAQARREEVDVESLRAQVAGDMHRDTLIALDAKAREIEELKDMLEQARASEGLHEAIVAELRANWPTATLVAVGWGTEWTEGETLRPLLVSLELPAPLTDDERARLESWLTVRAKAEHILLVVSVAPATAPP